MFVKSLSLYSFLQSTLAKNSSPLIFCSQKGFLAAREYFPTWFLFTAHPNTLNFILQLDNWRHTNTLNFTLLYIAPRKYFPTRFPFTQILLTLYYNWTMGATQILFTLHCFTLLPENTSPLGFLSPAHPNTAPPTQIHFTLQLDNGRHQVDTPPTKNSHKLSMYFQLNLLTHRSQILTKLNTVKPSSIVART